MGEKKGLLKTALIITLIFTFIIGGVYAVFNGIIEIIEETLGNIVNFLTNPLAFLEHTVQQAWNTVVEVLPNPLGAEYQVDKKEQCRFFIDSDMVDQLAENLSSGGVLTDNAAFYGGGGSSSNSGESETSEGDITTDVSAKIVSSAKTTPSSGPGWCLKWVDSVYDRAGVLTNRRNNCIQRLEGPWHFIKQK